MITEEIVRLFYENGYEKTSIRDIAKSLELPNSALYYYFQNKQDMLFTIIDDMMEKTLQTLRERTKDLKGPELKLSLIIDNHIRLYVEHRFQMKVLLHEVNSLEGEYSKIIKEKEREYVNYLKDVLREIIKKYGYKIDLNVATFCLFGMVKLDYAWYDPEGNVSPENLSKSILSIILSDLKTKSI